MHVAPASKQARVRDEEDEDEDRHETEGTRARRGSNGQQDWQAAGQFERPGDEAINGVDGRGKQLPG